MQRKRTAASKTSNSIFVVEREQRISTSSLRVILLVVLDLKFSFEMVYVRVRSWLISYLVYSHYILTLFQD